MKIAIQTIKNHLDNIELMIEAYYKWGKPAEECLTEIGRSVNQIKLRIDLIETEERYR